MKLLVDLARRQELEGKIKAMARGDKINYTEDRAVLHMVGSAWGSWGSGGGVGGRASGFLG